VRELVLKRVLLSLVTIIVLVVAVFFLGRLSGNPAVLFLRDGSTQEDLERITAAFGLDRPLPEQFVEFVSHAVRGDLGDSLRQRRPAIEVVFEGVIPTLQLAGTALALVLVLGVPLGILAALRRDRISDRLIRFFVVLGQAIPNFWLAIMLILIFGVWLKWLPFAGLEGWQGLVLPSVSLAMLPLAGVVRLIRAGMLESLGEDYVEFARSMGLRKRIINLRFALRNALIPVVTYLGFTFVSSFLTGAVVAEVIFSRPGIGRLAYEATVFRDFPVLQAATLLAGGLFVLGNFLVDLSYAWLDPRTRESQT